MKNSKQQNMQNKVSEPKQAQNKTQNCGAKAKASQSGASSKAKMTSGAKSCK